MGHQEDCSAGDQGGISPLLLEDVQYCGVISSVLQEDTISTVG